LQTLIVALNCVLGKDRRVLFGERRTLRPGPRVVLGISMTSPDIVSRMVTVSKIVIQNRFERKCKKNNAVSDPERFRGFDAEAELLDGFFYRAGL
jgi:hypothetical protein